MKKLFLTLVSLFAVVATQTAMAQNMTQLEAINNLTGFWTTTPTNNVPQSTLNFENRSNPAQRYLTTTGFANKSYNNWGIHTNTFNFSTGVIQATNSSPFLNDNYNYRNLTPTTCEFRINGYWVNAQKGRGGQQTITPVNNNNNNNRPVTNVVTPVNNNNNNNRPVTNNNNNNRPVTNNNNNNNNEIKDGSNLQLTFPPDIPGTIAPTNNNNTNNNNNNSTSIRYVNGDGRVITVDNNYTPPTHNTVGNVRVAMDDNNAGSNNNNNGMQEGRTVIDNTTPANNNDNNRTRGNRGRNIRRSNNSSSNSNNPVNVRRRGTRR